MQIIYPEAHNLFDYRNVSFTILLIPCVILSHISFTFHCESRQFPLYIALFSL